MALAVSEFFVFFVAVILWATTVVKATMQTPATIITTPATHVHGHELRPYNHPPPQVSATDGLLIRATQTSLTAVP